MSQRHICSIAQVRAMDDVTLTECYVKAIGYTGLSAIAEHPVPARTPVLVDVTFVNQSGQLEAETVAGRVVGCSQGPGAYLLDVAFVQAMKPESSSRLALFIAQDLGPSRPKNVEPRYREAQAGNA